MLQSFEDAGVVLPGSARPDRSVLYAAIGAEGDLKLAVDRKQDVRDGDAFLMCTDGIWDNVSIMEMEQLLQESTTVEEWVRGVAGRVAGEHRESQDNYTALGVWVGSPEQTTITRDATGTLRLHTVADATPSRPKWRPSAVREAFRRSALRLDPHA